LRQPGFSGSVQVSDLSGSVRTGINRVTASFAPPSKRPACGRNAGAAGRCGANRTAARRQSPAASAGPRHGLAARSAHGTGRPVRQREQTAIWADAANTARPKCVGSAAYWAAARARGWGGLSGWLRLTTCGLLAASAALIMRSLLSRSTSATTPLNYDPRALVVPRKDALSQD
jgi:hypothetical protein